MPTYGYHCPRCQSEFEVFQRMTDDSGAGCPQCGTPGRRLYFPAGIVFKGSGFYKTDSRGAASASGNGSSSAGRSTSSNGGKPATAEKPASGTTGSVATSERGASSAESSTQS